MTILAIQLKRIGDSILTAPALASLRAHYPMARITLLLAEHSGSLAEGFVSVDEVVVWQGGRTLWSLGRRRWDLALDFTGSDRSALILRVTRAARRYGYEKFMGGSWWKRTAVTWLCPASVSALTTVEFHQALLGAEVPMGDETGFRVADASFPSDVAEIASVAAAGPYVVVHPGTFRREKLWLSERWAEVVAVCPYPVILTGSNDPVERAHVDAIKAALELRTGVRLPQVVDALGRLSLLQLAAVIARAKVVLGVDSAAMHLAAMTLRPQVALFGPTNPYHWAPRHPKARVIAVGSQDDRGKFRRGEMADIPVDSVCQALEELLQSSA